MTDWSVTSGCSMREDRRRKPNTAAGGRRRPRARPAAAATAARGPEAAAASSPRKRQPAARRQAILDAALGVFAAHGFEAARLDDIAARAGVAKGTLYLHFK